MADAAEAWLDSLQEMLERDLIETGYISGATREFWDTVVGYANPTHPNYNTSRDYVYALSERLRVPPTNDLDELEQEYQQRHYTRRCLSFGVAPGKCLVGATEYGHMEVVNASLPLLGPEDAGSVVSAAVEAIKNNYMDVILALDPHVESFQEILEAAALHGRLEMLQHELEQAKSRGYRPKMRQILSNAAASGDIPTTEYLLGAYLRDAAIYDRNMLEDAIKAGHVDMIAYLLAWSQNRPGGAYPFYAVDVIVDAMKYRKYNVFVAFVEDVRLEWIAANTVTMAEANLPEFLRYTLSYLEERGRLDLVKFGSVIEAGVEAANSETVAIALSFADRDHRTFRSLQVKRWFQAAIERSDVATAGLLAARLPGGFADSRLRRLLPLAIEKGDDEFVRAVVKAQRIPAAERAQLGI